jgi:DivIVA domain-containing protein
VPPGPGRLPSAGSRGRIGVVLALFIVLAIVVVAGVAVLVVRDRPLIADDPVGSRALAWSTEDGVRPEDLAEVRFAVVLRGYRMDEVDRVLDDAREALAVRDERIADLHRVVEALGGAPSAGYEVAVTASTAEDEA